MSLKIGRHQCKVERAIGGWFATAGEKETPFIRLPLVITEGENEGESEVYQAWISDSAAARTIKNLREVFPKWDGDLAALAQHENGDGPFVDELCSIVVEEEEYKGKKRTKIAWLNPPGGGDKLMEANRALQLARRLMGQSDDTERQPKRAVGGYGAQRQRPSEPEGEPDLSEEKRDADGNFIF